MNLRQIVGNPDNKQLLADIAIKFLPVAESQTRQMLAGIKGSKAGVNRAIDVQRDCKWIMNHRSMFPSSVVAWATKSKEDANFEEHRYQAEKQNFQEGYREGRRLEFLLRSVIKSAFSEQEGEDVSNHS